MRCAICCRRSRRCCTADWAGIRWFGSRCCARRASAPGAACAGPHRAVDFASLFQDVLTQFDTQPDVSRPAGAGRTGGPDGRAAGGGLRHAGLEIDDSESRQRVLTSEPAVPTPPGGRLSCLLLLPAGLRASAATRLVCAARHHAVRASGASGAPPASPGAPEEQHRATRRAPARGIVTPAPTTERLQSISGWSRTSSATSCPTSRPTLRAIPCAGLAGSIPSLGRLVHRAGLDVPDRLRRHIAQFALRSPGSGGGRPHRASDGGIGFVCVTPAVGGRRRCRRSRGRCWPCCMR